MTSRPYAEVIGDPIAHSKSPLIHNFWLEKLGIDAEYRAKRVRGEELEFYFNARKQDRDWRGCNVTIPHKEQVFGFADIVDEAAQAIGASNCLFRDSEHRLIATNTDVEGVRAAIGVLSLAGADVCVLGGGGAARAAFHALKGSRCSLLVLARDPDKAARAAVEAGTSGRGVSLEAGNNALAGASLFINATQLGMVGQAAMPSHILSDLSDMAPGAMVFDMVYAPLETELLREARARGLVTVDGLEMLVAQAASAFELLFGQAPPREHDAELRRRLTV